MICTMRPRSPLTALGLATLAACAQPQAPAPKVAGPPGAPPAAASAPEPTAPPQYVVADPPRATALTVVPVGVYQNGMATGVVLEGLRLVVRGADVRVARDAADAPIQSAWRVPARLGGGFLFRARAALYTSDAFDGLLRPVVTLPAEVATVSFGPKAILARSDQGERWMIDPASGRRLPIAPPGLLDVAALDDGRAAALAEGGAVLVSSDAGEHWTDATARLRAPAQRVFVEDGAAATPPRDDALWIETQGGPALRLMPGGRLAEYDAAPAAKPAEPLRPKDTRWREDEAPIRRAIRLGAPVDDTSALVVVSGDLVKVNVVTGTIDVVAAGKLPPDATCAGTRTADDVVFTCGRANGGSFVVARTLEGAPVIEQAFDAGRFVVADDGGVAYLGRCDGGGKARRAVCVRGGGAGWREYDLDEAEGGASSFEVVRWIPRADGDAVAVVNNIGGASGGWGMIDARAGEVRAWPADAPSAQARAALAASADAGRGGSAEVARLADRGWTVTPQGTLRGWATVPGGAASIEVGIDGAVQTSPFAFERIAAAGTLALARQRDGRVWQTLDRGVSWSEVATPPASRPGGWLDPHACSAVGCDMGQWYRVGWAPVPPSAPAPPTVAPSPAHVERLPVPSMACRNAGEGKRAAVARTERSPDDLGLGAGRVAVSDGGGRVDYLRIAFARRIVGAVRDTDANDEGAPRALLHGLATQPGDDRLVVSGPNRDITALSRQVAFVVPFDPLGSVRRAGVAVRDLLAAGRAAGTAAAELLRDDAIPSAVVPVTPVDGAAPSDLLVQLTGGGLVWARGSGAARPRTVFEPGRSEDWRVVSAAALDGEGLAWLEQDASGRARVLRVPRAGAAAGPPATAFELEPPPTPSSVRPTSTRSASARTVSSPWCARRRAGSPPRPSTRPWR
jgi:hypothetical protein